MLPLPGNYERPLSGTSSSMPVALTPCSKFGCSNAVSFFEVRCGYEFCFKCGAPYNGPEGIRGTKGNNAHAPSCAYYSPI